MTSNLHGVPAFIWRKSDGKKYPVSAVFYDGDKHGYVITITISDCGMPIKLFPGEYRTHSIYYWQTILEMLEIRNLD